ncbi:hypothetical protein [Parvibaculum sp.]|uniref:hypothetical protein n=1 Tax=Parvibaculum sp. TaxID=2024848 RepID=UPI002CBFC486|nr:hypothetical protein [Parvibaculum sp.]HUD52215.1 hypothetical protein [Parvibaculum sp.]
MKPEVDTALGGFFVTLMTEIAPQLGGEYSTGSVGLIGMSIAMAAQEYDRAADIRVRENEAMRALFAEAARLVEDEARDISLVEDKAFAKRLLDAAATKDTSFKVSALNASNDALKSLLIELHAAVETSKASWASALDRKIWDLLVEAAEGRKLVFPLAG